MPLPQLQPMPLGRAPEPFSHPDWLYEIKWDGFRALLYSNKSGVQLVSRNGNTFKSFARLCEGLARDLNGRRCVLDGEIVCLDQYGKPRFKDLLFRRGEPFFYAFDILWDEHPSSDEGLFRLVCEQDLEGIVAKRKTDPYLVEYASWLKIRNQNYSQWIGRDELFERERSSDPDLAGWDECVRACAASTAGD